VPGKTDHAWQRTKLKMAPLGHCIYIMYVHMVTVPHGL
jgi:hypothetical protein